MTNDSDHQLIDENDRRWKIGVIGASSSGKTTLFHQLYHLLPKDVGAIGINFHLHEEFENVDSTEFVPRSNENLALTITGTINVGRKKFGLDIIDTLGGHLTDPRSEETHHDFLQKTKELDMLILAVAPENVFGQDTRAITAMQEHINNLNFSNSRLKRIALAYTKSDEYALQDRPVRLLNSKNQKNLLKKWIDAREQGIQDRIESSWEEFVNAAADGDATINSLLSKTEFLWRVIHEATGITDNQFNAYLVQSRPADPPVPIEYFRIKKRGLNEMFEDFIKQIQTENGNTLVLNWPIIAGMWNILWFVLTFAFIFARK